jgi:ribosome biogenesis GTPase
MDTPITLSSTQGLIISKTTGAYGVQAGDQRLRCGLGGRLRPEQVVVGDRVRLAGAQIVDVLPRRNQLARRGVPSRAGAHTFEQVIAANVDQVAPVFAAASPAPKWNLLDRYLAAAGALDLPALIVLTKADLAPAADDELPAALDEYRRLGYPVHATSAHSGVGLAALRDALAGRVTLLLGKSGVGKTSLLNGLEPGLGLRVAEVSAATGKGRHTTTQVALFPLAGGSGGGVIDTPGTREFGLWDVDPDALALYFPEMRPLVGRCKFGLDCRHDEEPGCAIRQAVLAGAISPRRYQSYIRLRFENA